MKIDRVVYVIHVAYYFVFCFGYFYDTCSVVLCVAQSCEKGAFFGLDLLL